MFCRLIALTFIVLFVHPVYAQTIQKYFDYSWKECTAEHARFIRIVVKTDTGWHCKDYFLHEENNIQMDGTYLDSACKVRNGIFYYFHPDKKIQSYGRYAKGKKEGLWLSYHSNGVISDSVAYISGNKTGICMSWYANGYPKDSLSITENTTTSVSWFDNGQLSSAGRYDKEFKLIGTWMFYHKNGNLATKESYTAEGAVKEKSYYDEKGTLIETGLQQSAAVFSSGIAAWQKYLSSKLYFPSNTVITNADKAVVVVAFIIDEDGKVIEANIVTPFYRQFNDIAKAAILKSPKWKPAIEHNRRVRYSFTQAVTFAQEQE